MIALLVLGLLGCAPALPSPTPDSRHVREGDIIFQVSHSSQSAAVAGASGSPITHVGLIAVEGDTVTVIEAVEPVGEVPIVQFIERGGMWGVYRLTDPPPDPTWGSLVVRAGRAMKGRRYDGLFQWNDDRIYCSELVWKAFARGAGIRLTETQRLGELDLSLPPVQALIKKRTGERALNLDEQIVTPGALHRSDLLTRVMGFI